MIKSRNLLIACFLVCNINLQDTTSLFPDESHIGKTIWIDFNKLELAIKDIKEEFPDKYDVGGTSVANLFTANSDGTEIRQVCFDQYHDYHPTILNNGQVMYNRWDYTGISHAFLREIMVMNPDGTEYLMVK